MRDHFRCSHSLSYWTKIIVFCTCGTCLCLPEKTRKLNKDRFDTLSIPNCVIKNCPTHGARHGNTEEQRIYHVAHNAYKRCLEKKDDDILDRFLNSPRYRASQTEQGWTEELCAKYDALAQEDHSYTYTAWEHRRLASTWKLQSQTDRWQNDLIMQKIKNRPHQESGEAKEGIHPSEQGRLRCHNPFSKTSPESARVDRKTGWRRYSSTSLWYASESWWTSSSWDENFFTKKKSCRNSLSGNSDSL